LYEFARKDYNDDNTNRDTNPGNKTLCNVQKKIDERRKKNLFANFSFRLFEKKLASVRKRGVHM